MVLALPKWLSSQESGISGSIFELAMVLSGVVVHGLGFTGLLRHGKALKAVVNKL